MAKRRATDAERHPSDNQESQKAPPIDRLKERKAYALLIGCLMGLAIILTILALRIPVQREEQQAEPLSITVPPFDASTPFTLADLTASQVAELRKAGEMRVSDGPRGISIGDSLDKLLSSYPAYNAFAMAEDEQVLYCASTFQNESGSNTALPPRGLLTAVDGREITVTLMAPTSEYPPGTAENYRHFEHVFCKYTIDPETMLVSSIHLGITK